MNKTYLTDIEFPEDMYGEDVVLADSLDTHLTRLDRALQRCNSENIHEWLAFHSWKTKEFTSKSHMKKHMRLLKKFINNKECPDRPEQKASVIVTDIVSIL